MRLENITSNLTEGLVRADKELITQIQAKLRGLGLYPGGKFVDGDYGPRSRGAIKKFCDVSGLPFPKFDENFAWNLLFAQQIPSILEIARSDREALFRYLLGIGQATKLSVNDQAAFLHRDIQNSKFITEIPSYPNRLATKYVTHTLPSNFNPYPERGVIPDIDNQGLAFLNADIQEACVCVGHFANGQIQTRWLGKNALERRQFWSATKILPVLNVICDANTQFPDIDVASCYVTDKKYKFTDLVLDIVNYRGKITSSNSAAAMFKQFKNPTALENWVKNITGNQQLSFRSGYGEPPFIRQPQLIDRFSGKQVLNPPLNMLEEDKNYLSAYDLVRFISMLGWHLHLTEDARLPEARWQSLKSIITALGYDRARYLEVALETLGLENAIASPVIISKLGNGFSQSRGTNEITYVAFMEFIDERIRVSSQLGKFRTFAIALRGVVKSPRTMIELDARVATEVTEILRRVVTDEIP